MSFGFDTLISISAAVAPCVALVWLVARLSAASTGLSAQYRTFIYRTFMFGFLIAFPVGVIETTLS